MNDLEKIKEILFGNEKKALDAVLRRLDTPESRAADVADVLPDAVTRSYSTNERLGRALSQPVEEALSEAIRKQPKKFADALFPIMGPAIRKAISEALKSMVETVNTAMDTNLSPSAHIKAWRAGVPMVEWALQQSLVYRVDEIYLIDPQSGLLISHLHHPNVIVKDEDAVSGMLTAIQDFVSDSFTEGAGGGLDSAVIGEHTVWLSQGPHAMLACVIRGVPPVRLKEEISSVNERLHLRYSNALADFSGDSEAIPGLEMDLEELLRIERKQKEEEKGSAFLSPPLLITLLVLLAVLGWFLIRGILLDNKLDALKGMIDSTPGIVTTAVSRDGADFTIRGLRDPLAKDIGELVEGAGIKLGNAAIDMRAYQSLESEIVKARVMKMLGAPAGVNLKLAADTLIVTGTADPDWKAKLELLGPVLPGISSVDSAGLREDDAVLAARVRALLSNNSSVDVSVTDGNAVIAGIASISETTILNQIQERIPGLAAVDVSGLQVAEEARRLEVRRLLNGTELFFSEGTRLLSSQDATVLHIANRVQEYIGLCEMLGRKAKIRLVGFADSTGSPDANRNLKNTRADVVRKELLQLGIPTEVLTTATGAPAAQAGVDNSMRKVQIQIIDP